MDPKPQSRATAAGTSRLLGAAAPAWVPREPGGPHRLTELAAELPAARPLHQPLWLAGDTQALQARPAVTIIGARAATAAGEALAQALGAAVAERGGLVVSGGALGIDGAAHRGALLVNGRTCAVLGCGVDIAYPQRHHRLFEQIRERGCLLSGFPPGTQPAQWHFPARNELMAALADLVVIIEARADSGSLITAKQARRHGRAIAAFPGSAGTTAALAAGAQAVHTVAEVLALLERSEQDLYRSPQAPGSRGAGPAVAAARPAGRARRALPDEFALAQSFISECSAAADGVLAALAQSVSPSDLGELCARTGLSPGDCAAALVDLELRGRCTRLAGGRYIVHAPLG